MMANTKVAISIVTYNSKHIFKVLENLKQEFGQDPQFRFVIFDNNSNDEYKNRLKEYQDFVDITFYHENNGFGFGIIIIYCKLLKNISWYLILTLFWLGKIY
ncbi:hypothetical protein NDK43_31790 [Neobacillus pocheonensis]|uniref:Glycosyltransferase n=1 Tax=Neobacillus pocheonensis TaxID=363869 RepID=A0ABT0WI92_9BACI|nr:hypothetical protein [Neobacillus pocheonensis]